MSDTYPTTVGPGEWALLGRLPSGRAVLGQTQFLPGYSLLLADDPAADRLSDLPHMRRVAFLVSMERLAEAVENVCRRRDPGFRRVNLEIQGNLAPRLHAHIWPRYEWESRARKIRQVGRYPLNRWHKPETQLSQTHTRLRDDLRAELAALGRTEATS